MAAIGRREDEAVPRGSLVFAGENPGALLVREDGGRVAVSWWRSAWSPAGGGHVLALTVPDGPPLVMTDSPELAGVVVPTFLRHWGLFGGADLTAATVGEADVDPRIARAAREVSVRATSRSAAAGRTVVVRWLDLGPATTHPVHGHDAVTWHGRPLLVDHHVSRAERVEVVVDGVPLHEGAEPVEGYVTLAERWWTS